MINYIHQDNALTFAAARDVYALLMEQGTGKSRVIILDAARRWLAQQIDRIVVMAPNGVHTNWLINEFPAHWPQEQVAPLMAGWYAGARKFEREAIEAVLAPRSDSRLRVLAINWEALISEDGYRAVMRFMQGAGKRPMAVGDESHRIKTPKTKTTKAALRVRTYAVVKAILTGTAITGKPWDAYSQFGFLNPDILQSASYTAFKAEYAELLPKGHHLLRHIMQRTRGAFEPQIVARDENGRPKWRNLTRLNQLIAPHSFRVLKKDCLDLPEKLPPVRRYFRMTPKQVTAYNHLVTTLRLTVEGRERPVDRIASITKLSQITSGYFVDPATDRIERLVSREQNPRIIAAMDEIESYVEDGHHFIVWARFHAELDDLAWALGERGITFVPYDGRVGRDERVAGVERFQRGEAQGFLGQQQAGGTGLTLTRAQDVLYYSNTYSLVDRLQSEDRPHRIGQRNVVGYTDLVAQGTCDEDIVAAHHAKLDVAQIILGDHQQRFLREIPT